MNKVIDYSLIEKAANLFCDLFQLSSCLERDSFEVHGVTRVQSYAIMHLSNNECCSLQELSMKLKLAPSTLSRVMDKLVDRRLVDRNFDQNDRRRMIFQLSDEGEHVAETIHGCFEEMYSMIMSEIPDDEQEKFLEHLGSILNKLRDKHKQCCCGVASKKDQLSTVKSDDERR